MRIVFDDTTSMRKKQRTKDIDVRSNGDANPALMAEGNALEFTAVFPRSVDAWFSQEAAGFAAHIERDCPALDEEASLTEAGFQITGHFSGSAKLVSNRFAVEVDEDIWMKRLMTM